MSRPGPSDVEVLDHHGDLKLIVGADKVVFKVCSRSLARSSPVWNTLLYGPFSEGKNQQNSDSWEIALLEDNPEGLRVILNAVHHKSAAMPKVGSCSLIFKVTVLADKYDMVATLKPFWSGWRCRHAAEKFSTAAPSWILMHLWVSHTLGDGRGFRRSLMTLASRTAIDADGKLSVDGHQLDVISESFNIPSQNVIGEYHFSGYRRVPVDLTITN
jgi:hypothetical protein